MPSQHAFLSPSAAHRWLNCTAAPAIEAKFPDVETDFAAEGTLAHAICATKLKEALGQAHPEEDTEVHDLWDKYYNVEMEEYTDSYVDTVLQAYNEARQKTTDATLLVEQRLDFGKRVPESFGTSDAIIVADNTLHVFDFKYGKGVKVSADHNPQMMIYALGAYDAFSLEYDIRTISMSIVQPRLANFDTYEIIVSDLLDWSDTELEPKAKEAFGKEGEMHPGDWCRFCKAKGQCKALALHCLIETLPNSGTLSNAEIGRILPQISLIKDWCSAIEDTALGKIMNGEEIEGWKVVEGRSVRKISDVESVKATLSRNGYKENDYMRPAELRSITELEKNIGKKAFGTLCGDFIVKPTGKPTLAPISDKRFPISSAAKDFEDMNL